MRQRLSDSISILLLICFLGGGLAFDAPAQSIEVEIECELFLRSQSISHILDKKDKVSIPFNPSSERQINVYLSEQLLGYSKIINFNKGNSLYLFNSSFLI